MVTATQPKIVSVATAFLRSWLRPEWLAEDGEGEEFEQVFNVAVNGNIGRVFRHFHAEHGR